MKLADEIRQAAENDRDAHGVTTPAKEKRLLGPRSDHEAKWEALTGQKPYQP